MGKTSEAQKQANKKYKQKNIGRVIFNVKKGNKAILKDVAAYHKITMPEYIRQAVYKQLEKDENDLTKQTEV